MTRFFTIRHEVFIYVLIWKGKQYLLCLLTDEEKKFTLGDKLAMICIGEDGDVAQFGDWCKRNIQLYKLRYGK